MHKNQAKSYQIEYLSFDINTHKNNKARPCTRPGLYNLKVSDLKSSIDYLIEKEEMSEMCVTYTQLLMC